MGIDALSLDVSSLNNADLIITNPPFTRQLMHDLIQHLSALKPTWLLIDADWAFTDQAQLIIHKLCTDIVVIGRLKWIEGTNMSSKDSYAWYRFSTDKSEPTVFNTKNVNK